RGDASIWITGTNDPETNLPSGVPATVAPGSAISVQATISIPADVRDNRITVADRPAIVDDVGKLSARRSRSVEDVLVRERHAGQFEEHKHLEAVVIVISDAEQFRVGIKSVGSHRNERPKIC